MKLQIPDEPPQPAPPPPEPVEHPGSLVLPSPVSDVEPSLPGPGLQPPSAEPPVVLATPSDPRSARADPWAGPPTPSREPPPGPPPPVASFDRPAAGAFKGNAYGRFGKK